MCAGPLISSELLIVLSSHNSWFGWLWWVHRTELVAVEGCNGMMETQWQQMASWPKANAWASSAICHLVAILSSGMAPVRYGWCGRVPGLPSDRARQLDPVSLKRRNDKSFSQHHLWLWNERCHSADMCPSIGGESASHPATGHENTFFSVLHILAKSLELCILLQSSTVLRVE